MIKNDSAKTTFVIVSTMCMALVWTPVSIADEFDAADYNQRSHRVWDEHLSPVDVSRVGLWINGMAQPGFRPDELLRDIQKLQQANPGLGNEELANRLLEKHPNLAEPGGVNDLQEWMKSLNRLAGIDPPGPTRPAPNGGPTRPSPPPRRQDSHPPSINRRHPHFRDNPFAPGTPPTPDGTGFEPGSDPEHMGFLEEDEYASQDASRRHRQYLAIKRFWDSNVGPLDETPALQELMMQMFVGQNPVDMDAGDRLAALLGDTSGEPGKPAGPSASADRPKSDGVRFAGWTLSDLGLGQLAKDAFGRSSPPARPLPYSESDVDWPTVAAVVGAIVVAGFLGRRMAGRVGGRWSNANAAARLAGPGRWPIDPRSISTRDDVVRAFEYLAVALCGVGSMTWHHERIAAELPTHLPESFPHDAVETLVGQYEVAKYAPADEPFPPASVASVRELFCRLAGVRVS